MTSELETEERQRTRVVTELKARIDSGTWDGEEGRLPPLRSLAQEFRAGRNTMEEALEELKRLGIVYSRPRVGYFLRNRSRPTKKSLSEDDCCRGVVLWPGLGNLAEAQALTSEWRAFLEARMREGEGEALVRCAPCDGAADLREAVAELLPPPGFSAVAPSNVLLTQGATSGLSLALTQILATSPHRRVAFENPCFLPIDLQEPVLRGIELVPIPRKGEDFGLEALEAEAERGLAAVVVSPTLQNPEGASLSLQTRFSIAAVALRSKMTVVELSPQEWLLASGTPTPSIASLCPQHTLYVSSLSKVLGSGLRVGWLVANEAFLAWHKERCVRPSCNHTPIFPQETVAAFLRSGHFEKHLDLLLGSLQRSAKMCAALAEETGVGRLAPWTGGIFAKLFLDNIEDLDGFCRRARSSGAFLRPDTAFFWQGRNTGPRWMRLNLSQCVDGAARDVFRLLTT